MNYVLDVCLATVVELERLCGLTLKMPLKSSPMHMPSYEKEPKPEGNNGELTFFAGDTWLWL